MMASRSDTRPHRQLAALLIAAGLMAGCHGGSSDDSGGSASVPAVVGARVQAAATRPFTETVAAIGTVVPQAEHVAVLSAPVATWVARIFVNTGQVVRRGDSLVAFETSTFDANLQSADAAYQAALQNRDRVQRLVQEGIDPQKDLDQAEADLARAAADRVTARQAASLAMMRSPIDGVVLDMNATLGASVDPAQPLVEIADPDHVDVMFAVSPDAAGQIRRGDSVRLHAGSAVGSTSLGIGRVVDIGGEIDSAGRTLPVRVRAGGGAALRLGETVFGDIVTALHRDAVVVPTEALVPQGDGYEVFVVDDSNVAHQRIVVTGGAPIHWSRLFQV